MLTFRCGSNQKATDSTQDRMYFVLNGEPLLGLDYDAYVGPIPDSGWIFGPKPNNDFLIGLGYQTKGFQAHINNTFLTEIGLKIYKGFESFI